MESLLRWSIEHSTPGATPSAPRRDIGPGVIDVILGKPESELMKEALAIAVDESKDEDERLGALDDFEMVRTPRCIKIMSTLTGATKLVEQIDNANSM